jgi:hypothetical protein
MSSQLRFPTYNAPPWGGDGKWPISIGLVLIFMGLSVRALLQSGVSLWFGVGLPALVLVLLLGPAVNLRRMYTDTDREHLIIRGAFRTRRTAWRDIRAIAIEHRARLDYAVASDRDGRRMTLPFVNSSNLPDLHADVSRLRELWVALRGEDWAEDPELERE